MVAFGTFFAGELGWMERGCLRSFLRHGHSITLYCYDPVGAVPDGVDVRDASTILPRATFFEADHGPHMGTVGAFSDLFRYAMIRATGLIWIDTDVICLRPDWPDLPLLAGFQDAVMVNGAVLGGGRDLPLFERAFEVAHHIGAMGPWAYTGPHLLTALVHQFGHTQDIQPQRVFYPITYHEAMPFLLPPMHNAKAIQWPDDCLAVHLWNEMLRLSGYDKRAGPPENSLLKLIFADLGD